MAEIRWTEEAHRWLRNIHDYIAIENPDAAQKVVSEIYGKAQVLRRFPEIGHKHHTEADGEVRILLYGLSQRLFSEARYHHRHPRHIPRRTRH